MSDRRGGASRKSESPPPEWGFAGFTPSGESIYEPPRSSHSRTSPQNVPAETQLPTTTEENEETVQPVQQPPRRSQRTRRSTQREDYVYYQQATHRGEEEELTARSDQSISRNSEEHREGDSCEDEREVSTEPQRREEVFTLRPQPPTPRVKRTNRALASDNELITAVKKALDVLQVIKDDTYDEFDIPDEEKGKNKENGKNYLKKSPKKSPKRWRKRGPSDSPPGTPASSPAISQTTQCRFCFLEYALLQPPHLMRQSFLGVAFHLPSKAIHITKECEQQERRRNHVPGSVVIVKGTPNKWSNGGSIRWSSQGCHDIDAYSRKFCEVGIQPYWLVLTNKRGERIRDSHRNDSMIPAFYTNQMSALNSMDRGDHAKIRKANFESLNAGTSHLVTVNWNSYRLCISFLSKKIHQAVLIETKTAEISKTQKNTILIGGVTFLVSDSRLQVQEFKPISNRYLSQTLRETRRMHVKILSAREILAADLVRMLKQII
ncbi:hypothetical protein ACTXT7_013824 [Hymenolepis weldensis]